MTAQDLMDYDVAVADALGVTLNSEYKLWTTAPPSSGFIVGLILKILNGESVGGLGLKVTGNSSLSVQGAGFGRCSSVNGLCVVMYAQNHVFSSVMHQYDVRLP